MVLEGFGRVWKGLGGFGKGGEGWGGLRVTLQPPKPRQIVRCLRMLTHARSYLNPEAQCVIESNIDCRASDLGLTQQQIA